MKNILVIDGNSILNRAFFGIRPLTTKSGKNTNALFGMLNIILKQLESIKPDFAAVAFDLKAPNFRKLRYEEYKAGRHPTPPELLEQFPYAKECLHLLGIRTLELPGYEADDLLGTVAETANAVEDTHAYVLTGDRDMLQLLSPHVTVLLAGNADTVPYDRQVFFDRFGVEPTQYVDMKAIMGDASDNIPGVPGIGEKGAAKLISAFGSLDGIYENIDDKSITKGTREKLVNAKDSAYLSQFLARIEVHAPIAETLLDLAYNGIPDRDALRNFFKEYELLSFIRRFRLDEVRENAACPVEACDTPVFSDISAEQLIHDAPVLFAFDKSENDLLFSFGENKNYRYTGSLSALQPLFTKERTFITFDAKSKLHTLHDGGVDCQSAFCDIMLASYVIDSQSGNLTPENLTASLTGKTLPAGASAVPLYFELWNVLTEKVKEIGAENLLNDIETPLVSVLFRMETAGFRLDQDGLGAFGEKLLSRIADAEEKIGDLAGVAFNPNSPKQLGEVLFERLGLPTVKKKKKTGYSTDAEVLNALLPYHPIIGEILKYRQLSKLYSTYVVGLTKAMDENCRVHTDFKQALTATGRLSSAEPNLQNIPIRTELGREMRRFFIAENTDYTLVDADYSQIELRLLAAIADDASMRDAFLHGEDIHRKTAASVFGIPEEKVTDELRKRAKAINFGIVYGISGFSLSEDLGISVAEANAYIKAYLATYPKIDAYLHDVVAQAEETGYTATLFGRRRLIPELKAQNFNLRAFGKRVAMNSPIQGTAADIIKIAMIRVDRRLRSENLDARIIMQVHDELIIETRRSSAEKVAALLREEMENAVQLSVPLTVDVETGDTWLM